MTARHVGVRAKAGLPAAHGVLNAAAVRPVEADLEAGVSKVVATAGEAISAALKCRAPR